MIESPGKKIVVSFCIVAIISACTISGSPTNKDIVYAAENKKKVKFDSNGGKFKAKKHRGKTQVEKKIKKNKKKFRLPKVRKAGYTFRGWYTKKKGGKRLKKKSRLKRGKTYYARWGQTREQAILRHINKERELAGVDKLKLSKGLSEGASIRASEILDMETLSHKRPDGRSFSTVCPELAHGENSYLSFSNTKVKAKFVVEKWMESSSHKELIVRPYWKRVAVGYKKKKVVRNGHVRNLKTYVVLFTVRDK